MSISLWNIKTALLGELLLLLIMKQIAISLEGINLLLQTMDKERSIALSDLIIVICIDCMWKIEMEIGNT
jgi:hypothetical protein